MTAPSRVDARLSVDDETLGGRVTAHVLALLVSGSQPAAGELVRSVEDRFGLEARWELEAALMHLAGGSALPRIQREYAQSLLARGDLAQALQGAKLPGREVLSTIDDLLRLTSVYERSEAFVEMVQFMASFRDYAPFNNLLVRLQRPGCSFYATERDWRTRFHRRLKPDVNPMLILAPMHPVMLVFELDDTEGAPLPEELREFSRVRGQWDESWLVGAVANASRDRIQVDFRPLSSTNSGLATFARGDGGWKMRVSVHDGLDGPSRLGVLCHELAHIYLGHLGGDSDRWWPSRAGLGRHAMEIEAEAAAFIATTRLGLYSGSSAAYLSRHAQGGRLPGTVSLEMIAKVSGALERMAREELPPRRPRVGRQGQGAPR
jgi:hypothetical protein